MELEFERDGVTVLRGDPGRRAWAGAARAVADRVLTDWAGRADQWRNGRTWFVGVDALPNAEDGAVQGVALPLDLIAVAGWSAGERFHRAQLSVVFPGYPRRDGTETEAAHRYRINRAAAHVDGLHGEGAAKRRYLREPHRFILGIALDGCRAAPLVVWPGSHRRMRAALVAGVGERVPAEVDLTDAYVAARRGVFEAIEPVALPMAAGDAVLLHRHMLHGVAPWDAAVAEGADARRIAYFRPVLRDPAQWLCAEDDA